MVAAAAALFLRPMLVALDSLTQEERQSMPLNTVLKRSRCDFDAAPVAKTVDPDRVEVQTGFLFT